MALHLTFSDDPVQLADALGGELSRVWTRPLQPPVLLVPNRLIDKWLKLHLSSRRGVVAGIDGQFIEQFLWDLLAHPGETLAEIDGPLLQSWLMHLMREGGPVHTDARLAPLVAYTMAGGEAGAPIRRIMIAARLAGLFLEYEYSRPDLRDSTGTTRFQGILGVWPSTDFFTAKNPAAAAMERWQRPLYGMVFGPGGLAHEASASCGVHHTTLPRLAAARGRAELQRTAREHLNVPVFLYGIDGLSLFHRQALLDIAAAHDVYVYCLNPCSAFWEDVDTSPASVRRLAAARPPGPIDVRRALTLEDDGWRRFGQSDWDDATMPQVSAADNRLLQLWSHAGKENIMLWCQATEYDFTPLFTVPEPSPATVLAAVKQSLLLRQARADTPLAPDSSLTIYAAPGIRREVELMRDWVLQALHDDPTLTPRDIGVFVTDPAAYRAAIHEVLGGVAPADPRWISWQIADERAGESLTAGAIRGLIGLARGQFTRSRVLALVRNPLVCMSCGLDSTSLDMWEQWTTLLGVSHAFDEHDRERDGEHEPARQHTWAHAIDRLLAGHLAEHVVADALGNDDRAILASRDIASTGGDAVAVFARVVESLHADTQSLANKAHSWGDAVAQLRELLASWLAFDDTSRAEEQILAQYLSALSVLGGRDVFESAGFDREEFLRMAEHLADFELPGRSSLLTGALTISAIRPSRAIPFRMVFVMGLNEGPFPGNPLKDTLDLRSWAHIPGDNRPVRHAQYAFLELVVCARERLALSYIGRDIGKDEPRLPCSTVAELVAFVNDCIMDRATPAQALAPIAVPLLPEGGDGLAPQDLLCESQPLLPPSWSTEAAEIALATSCDTPASPAAHSVQGAGTPAPLTLTLGHMRGFLNDPLQYTLSRSLGLSDDASGVPEIQDREPFASDALCRWRILTRVGQTLADRILDGHAVPEDTAIRELLRDAYRTEIYRGMAPEGAFADLDRLALEPDCINLTSALSAVAASHAGGAFEPRAVLSQALGSRVHRYLTLAADDGQVHLRGGPTRVIRTHGETLRISAIAVSGSDPGKPDRPRYDLLLEPYLFALACVALEETPGEVEWEAIACGRAAKPIALSGKVRPADAAVWLSSVATQMTDTTFAYDHLPFVAVAGLWREAAQAEEDVDWSAEAIQSWIDSNSGEHGAYRIRLEALELTRRTIPVNAHALALRRFGAMFGVRP